ncbi:hypothetical protein [uncultured Lacinutrix sp.]|uniref:hypothetical protein n=1 Tax=uncultured Lacinutrix sp. TaxID=574032 RepID=UPI002635F557|nr:hypothetical protein [uncultured Lacinutrix sp.]
MKKIILFFIICSIGVKSYGQEKYFNSEKEIQDFSENVMLLFNQNKVSEAFLLLNDYWPIPKTEVELIEEKTIKGLNTVESIYGKAKGIKKINYSNLENITIRETYFSLYRVSALRFIFIYYKTEKGWIVNQFKWDEDFEDEF